MANLKCLAKTSKAWEALSRPDLISRRAHALLLMANGRRSERELTQLLGENINELAQGLLQQGYLQVNSVVTPLGEEL